jgi:serine/threonine-protein kinase HipA
MCQASGLMPGRKYQENGGPGIAAIVTLIRRVSSNPEVDVDRFLQANMLSWLIGGTDAHAKNYSLLLDAMDQARLAPLYDVSSQLPYTDLVAPRVSTKIGDHYDIARVRIGDWRKLAGACAMPENRMFEMLDEMIRVLPDHISAARDQAIEQGLKRSVVMPLSKPLIAHIAERAKAVRR